MNTLVEIREYWIQLGGYGEFLEFLEARYFPVCDGDRILGFVIKEKQSYSY